METTIYKYIILTTNNKLREPDCTCICTSICNSQIRESNVLLQSNNATRYICTCTSICNSQIREANVLLQSNNAREPDIYVHALVYATHKSEKQMYYYTLTMLENLIISYICIIQLRHLLEYKRPQHYTIKLMLYR